MNLPRVDERDIPWPNGHGLAATPKVGDALLDHADGIGIVRVLAKDLPAVARKPRLDLGEAWVAHECYLSAWVRILRFDNHH